jgi:uncharacterized membrane protein SpoIIM required for sporulation
VIIDIEKFIVQERPFWTELEAVLSEVEGDSGAVATFERAQRLHYLYERTAADLGRLTTFASEPELTRYLEALVAKAYAELHETRTKTERWRLISWFFQTFPRTVRKNAGALWLSIGITLVGALFGGAALALDPDAKPVLMPFPHLLKDPAKRVAEEERNRGEQLEGAKTGFSAQLMTHNTKVSILTMSLGIGWAVGSVVLLFYNGVMVGAIVVDYVLAGQTKFLAGWLLPHGSVEIPAILLAGQAGLMLGRAVIGWRDRRGLRSRLRALGPELVTLIGGVAVLLVWAGIIEAFFSQYHEPVLPYAVKIAFGLVQLVLLSVFLWRGGRKASKEENAE